MKLFVQEQQNGTSYMLDEDGDYVALLYSDHPQGAKLASLMASAPELMEALELAKAGLEAHVEWARGKEDYQLFTTTVFALQAIDEAIAKAKGEQ